MALGITRVSKPFEIMTAGSTSEGYFLSEDGLLYETSVGYPGLCLPTEELHKKKNLAHERFFQLAYLGAEKTRTHPRARYAWLNQYAMTKKFVVSCLVCQRNKPSHAKKTGLLQPLNIPAQPFVFI